MVLDNACLIAQSKQPLNGYVQQKTTGQPLPRINLGIHNIDAGTANPDGEFRLNVPASLKPGFPIVFYVDGWIVFSPNYNGEYGAVPFPGFDAPPIKLIVVRPRNPILRSEAGIHTLLLGATTQFNRLSAEAIGTGSRESAQQFLPVNLASFQADQTSDSYGRAKAAFKFWLARQSKMLGFTEEELADAIASWADKRKTPFDEGLSFLYLGRVDDALSLLSKIKTEAADTTLLRTIAFGYGLQKDWAASAKLLREAIAKNKVDPSLYSSLGHVLELDGKEQEASEAFAEAQRLKKENLGMSGSMASQPRTLDSTPKAYSYMDLTGIWEAVEPDSSHRYIKLIIRPDEFTGELQCEFDGQLCIVRRGNYDLVYDFNLILFHKYGSFSFAKATFLQGNRDRLSIENSGLGPLEFQRQGSVQNASTFSDQEFLGTWICRSDTQHEEFIVSLRRQAPNMLFCQFNGSSCHIYRHSEHSFYLASDRPDQYRSLELSMEGRNTVLIWLGSIPCKAELIQR
jgi:tetratricopeptide (TPR) repeat protein